MKIKSHVTSHSSLRKVWRIS